MRLSLIAFLILLPISTGFCMQKNTIHKFKLDNGLNIVVQEDHRAPVVVSQIWYKVGSVDESRGTTGLSHALEHMMFLGTKEVPNGEFSKVIADLGGYENAFTSEDQTVYYEEIGKQHLETCLKLEADRMRNLLFDEKDILRELEVIKEERRLRVEDDPHGLTWERFIATAYMSGGYQNPVIGWMADIEALTVSDLKKWYQKWYAPNQATLVVVGDVVADDVFALSKKYFADIPRGPEVADKPKDEVVSLGQKNIQVHVQSQVPYLLVGFDTPSMGSSAEEDAKDVYALMLLQAVLDGGYSARFEKNLIRRKTLASSIGVNYDPFQRYRTQFTISALPSEETDLQTLRSGISTEIEDIQKNGVEADELARAKMSFISEFVYDKDSMRQQAMQLGALTLIGFDVNKIDSIVDNIKEVSGTQVQRVAQKYLVSRGQTVAEMIPEPSE
tara:strand:+ start:15864 stop:17198 length:1335 start_codon:yes stop_codon:yes gene_type:complete